MSWNLQNCYLITVKNVKKVKKLFFSAFLFINHLVGMTLAAQIFQWNICSLWNLKKFYTDGKPFRQCIRKWEILKIAQICWVILHFWFFKNTKKNYLDKGQFFSFSILFTKCFHHLSILRSCTLSRHNFSSVTLLPFPDQNVLYNPWLKKLSTILLPC